MADTFMRNRTLWAIIVILIAISVTACNGKDEMRWKEEVRLHDDKTILIDRYSTAAKSGFPNSRRGNVLYQEIRYAPLGFFWSSPNTEVPISFELIDGDVYFATVPQKNPSGFCVDKKKGAYVAKFYRWLNGALREIEQQEAPVDLMRWNASGVSQWGHTNESDPTYLSMQDVNNSNYISSNDPPPTLRKFFEEKKKNYLMCP